jgi:hypothetical protein
MQQGFFYDFSNYGIHDRLSNDGITPRIQHFCNWEKPWRNVLLSIASFARTTDRSRS